MPNSDNGMSKLSWAEWKGAMGAKMQIVLRNQDTLFSRVNELSQKLAYLEGRAAAYGAIGGTIAGIVVYLAYTQDFHMLIFLFRRKFSTSPHIFPAGRIRTKKSRSFDRLAEKTISSLDNERQLSKQRGVISCVSVKRR